MIEYRERPSVVPGAVLWRSRCTAHATKAVLPDGCMDLIQVGGRLMVAGPDSTVQYTPANPGDELVAVRFAPGHAPALLGVPAGELRDVRVDLAELWPDRAVRRAADTVAAHGLEALVLGLRPEIDPLVDRIAAAAAAGTPVDRVATATGYGPRQLHRICTAAFGYGAKTLTRVLRMQRALSLARQGHPLGQVAVLAGYSDQAHFTRDVGALAGTTPRRLLAGPR